MKVQMIVTYGEQFCEDLKEALNCKNDDEFLGVFKGMVTQSMVQENIPDEELKVEFNIV